MVVLSSEHEAITELSLDNLAHLTQFVWPTKDAMNLCLSLDHSLTVLSSDAVTI